jgi:protein TonB
MKINSEKPRLANLLIAAMLIIMTSCSSGEKNPLPPEKASSSFQKQQEINAKTTPADEVPFVVVEKMPSFPGGDLALLKYISENTRYPEISKANKIQGRVVVRFCVTSKGGISQVSILKGVDPELDAEAIRIVSSLPAFEPGFQSGKPVPVWYMVPITFTLK